MATIGLLMIALGSALVYIGFHGGPGALIQSPGLTGVQSPAIPPPSYGKPGGLGY